MNRDEAPALAGQVDASAGLSPFERVGAGIRRWIQTRIWGMDIHPSARIAPTAHLDRTWPRGVHIGAGAQLGAYVVVLTHDVTRDVVGDTRIGARCKLGTRAIVMPNVTIGEDCLVMPGAMVVKDMPPNSVAIGNPATIQPRAAR